jgi:multidrug efflux pump subunit AcrA (membrane-fusion protein)
MERPSNVSILPGMSATVILDMKHKSAVKKTSFSVPVSAVSAVRKYDPFVWVVDAKTMKVKKTSIKAGPMSGDSIAVLSGLKAGQLIAVSGVNFLKEGQKVKKYIGRNSRNQQQDAPGGK